MSINRKSSKISIDKLFSREIPKEVRNDIDTAIELSKNDGREHSLTFCKPFNKNKIIVQSHARGGKEFTDVIGCSSRNSIKMGDFHTHPPNKDVIGITPSDGDFAGTILDSKENNIRQIGCISNHESDLIHCYRPQKNITDKKLIKYVKSSQLGFTDIEEDIGEDFEHKYFDSESFKKINPSPDRIVKNALGRSAMTLRTGQAVKELDKSSFCERIADYNVGVKNDKLNSKVSNECRERIKKQEFLGFRFSH